ncbi:peptide ABC transporter substrate-binding protein [Allostreptomyces psammosilenae]|uniref:Peptide/nickel transport system substrate-binding protein/oligopeptide transport system substrate-binding protein n=1 Tax=Allostreptomyces psammosilenae TaxID=1892865 RepID=A0A852ZTC2_9ACTN|nr:ABC transporter substrate-binding protein [Allostreptomyces psammosilenae]NYI04787.1 peptide/nickel transport system substrate-binding protein/oligopeptide transport system substrate-binding protein [Allostreptomyces psammosilenae]
MKSVPGGARLLAGALAAALLLTGCGGGDGEGGQPGGTFSVALTEPDHLTPGNTTSAYSFKVLQGLFDPPVTLDPATGEVVHLAAESLTSEDQRVWTLKVRPGQTFHDGEAVTARSFADAWNAAAYGPNGWANNYYFANVEGYDALNPEDPDGDGPQEAPPPTADTLSGLEVVDDTTLRITLTAPFSQYPITLAYTGFAPLPSAAFEDPEAFDQAPVGNGPFAMDGEWRHNEGITLRRYEDYAGPRPAKADGVEFIIYASADTAFTDLQASGVDVVTSIPAARVPEASRLLGDRFLTAPSGSMDYLGFPTFDERFADPRLRRAISMAIDREAIVQAVYNGAYAPATSLLAPIVPGYRETACGEACTFDPARARQLLDEAGGFDGTLNLWFSNADPTYEQWMQAIANQLKDNLGIADVQFRKVPAADYLTTLADRTQDGPYRNNWQMDYPSAQNYLEYLWGPGNRMGWENEEFNALIQQAGSAESIEASIPLYQRAEDIAIAELPMTPLWNWQDQIGHSENVSDVTVNQYNGLLLLERVSVG